MDLPDLHLPINGRLPKRLVQVVNHFVRAGSASREACMSPLAHPPLRGHRIDRRPPMLPPPPPATYSQFTLYLCVLGRLRAHRTFTLALAVVQVGALTKKVPSTENQPLLQGRHLSLSLRATSAMQSRVICALLTSPRHALFGEGGVTSSALGPL